MTYSDYGPGCMRNNGFIEGPVFQNQLQPNTNSLCGVRTNLVTSIFTRAVHRYEMIGLGLAQ